MTASELERRRAPSWDWNKAAHAGTAAVSFLTLSMFFVGFFVGIVTDSDLDSVEASLKEDIAEVETGIAEVETEIAASEARLAAAIESLRNEIRAINTRIDRHLEGHAE